MDQPGRERIKEIILKEAQKDVFDGVGRVFIETLRTDFNAANEDILEALKLLEYSHRVWPGIDDIHGMILVYFAERRLNPSDYRLNRGRRALLHR